MVKEKTIQAGFKHLMNEKEKQSKISHIKYDELKIQEYLLDGNKNIEISKFVFKARSKCLDIKTHKKWKYKNIICFGYNSENETGDEILNCIGYSDGKLCEKMQYSTFFDGTSREMGIVAKEMKKRLKVREKIIEEME